MRAVRKVLVIDDDPVVGRSFDRVLSEKGYEVNTALNGVDAMQKLARDDYDVVYTDIKMPGMDGLEVASRVKASRPWVPVVIITGYGTAANEAKAEAIGVSDFLRKPLSPEMIEGSAHKALRVIEGGAPKAVAPAMPAAAPLLPVEVTVEPRHEATEARTAQSVALMIAAPFLGLLFVLAFPFIGLGMLAWTALRPLAKPAKSIALFLKNVALFFAAPFIGLAYAVAFPFIGLALLARWGVRAWGKRSERE